MADQNATAILQSYLDFMSAAILAGDWDRYISRILLPFHIVTETVNINVTTATQLREGFDSFRASLRSQNVTEFIRLVESATFLDDGLISGRFVSHLLARGLRAAPPYTSQIALRLTDDQWRGVSIVNSLSKSSWPLKIPSSTEQSPTKPVKTEGSEE